MPRRETSPAMISNPGIAIAVSPAAAPVVLSPSEYWKILLQEWKIPILDSVGIDQEDDDNCDNKVTFLETTSDRINAYQNIELLMAVRRRDLAKLKTIAAESAANNKTMNACNRFGESILHVACRKGSLDVVQLLVGDSYVSAKGQEAQAACAGCDCSLLVRDDYGRTVLHDACWTVSPPWELLKLILKREPVLWRVSDVRGHLGLHYVPKSVWPQWMAFLTKNREILKRIMIHSYHHVDVMAQQQVPHQVPVMQQQQSQQQEGNATSATPTTATAAATTTANGPIVGAVNGDASTTATADVPPRNVPQHHPLPTPLPTSAHNSSDSSEAQAPSTTSASTSIPVSAAVAAQAATAQRVAVAQQAASAVLALGSGGGVAKTSSQEATAILARALAQANPAMMKTLSSSQSSSQQQKQQGVQVIPHVHVASSSQQQALPSQEAAIAVGPGPATVALDEALKAQLAGRRAGRREEVPTAGLTLKHKQKQAAGSQSLQEPQKQPESIVVAEAAVSSTSPNMKQAIPYAPSISMIAARLAGYQRATTKAELQQGSQGESLQAEAHEQQMRGLLRSRSRSNTMVEDQQQESSQSQQQVASSQQQQGAVPNPLPAVPNPLLTSSENEAVQQEPRQGQGVPSSITTTQKSTNNGNTNTNNATVPDPMASTRTAANASSTSDLLTAHPGSSSEKATVGNASFAKKDSSASSSSSSMTMSASPSVQEHQETSSTTTTTTTTDTDSDNAANNSNSSTDNTCTDANENGTENENETTNEDGNSSSSSSNNNDDDDNNNNNDNDHQGGDNKSSLAVVGTKKRLIG